jgi:predicted RNase H-like HicB family nuclease
MVRKVRFKAANRDLTTCIDREGDWYVAQCVEVDVASQGETVDEALANLSEAVELHFEPI